MGPEFHNYSDAERYSSAVDCDVIQATLVTMVYRQAKVDGELKFELSSIYDNL